MQAPDDDMRYEIAAMINDVAGLAAPAGEPRTVTGPVETALTNVLERIDQRLAQALEVEPPPDPEYVPQAWSVEVAYQQLAAVEAWAALASYALGSTYAPASPWPRGKAGWSKHVGEKLQEIVAKLRNVMRAVARALAAVGFSISVSFPWGISVGVSF